MNTKPRILAIDFETSPAKGYFFGSKWETNIVKMIEYEQILCVAWKWHGEKSVKVVGQDDFSSFRKGRLNDKELVKFFSEKMEQADFISAHNGDRFDLTVFNTRLLSHGLKPIPQSKSFDTKKIAKSRFHLPSNALNDIADFLKIGHKTPHTGIQMWIDCENGLESAWKLMKKYCKHDVELQDKVLEVLLPFVKKTIQKQNGVCPNPACQSDHIQSRGYNENRTKRKMKCMTCGQWFQTKI